MAGLKFLSVACLFSLVAAVPNAPQPTYYHGNGHGHGYGGKGQPYHATSSTVTVGSSVHWSRTVTTPTNTPTAAPERAQAVVDAFEFAWNGYSKYCFGQDELHPVANNCSNSRNGWGASAFDALSTAIIMRIPYIVNQILEYVPTVDFTMEPVAQANEAVSLFETTIRYLGGMLSAYDLLNGPASDLVTNQTLVDALLSQAQTLANTLKYAFDTPTGIPHNNLFVNNHSTDGATNNGIATIGTLVLEWQHLSDLTGDPTYGELAQRAESYLLNPHPASSEPFPGLIGTYVNISNGNFLDASGGWIGGDDSYYEYLLKMYVYDSSRYSNYLNHWITAADSTMQYLTSHPSSRPDLTFVAQFDGRMTINESQHLACFDGGNFLLGGEVLRRQDLIDYGLALVNGCRDTYYEDATGIGPEQFSWNTTTLPTDQVAFYERAGFWILNSEYILRPEVLESYYYAYRITGNSMYQDWAWEAFMAINSTTIANSGYSEISDVNAIGGGAKLDFQDSFLFAEVMKYSYMIQAASAEWDVNFNGENYFVFNTEAHPFKVWGPPVPSHGYGT